MPHDPLLAAIDLLKAADEAGARALPKRLPSGFLPPKWRRMIFAGPVSDRRLYETAVLATLRDRLRGAGVRVAGSRDHRAFEDYLLPAEPGGVATTVKERKLYAAEKPDIYPVLKPLIGEPVNTAALVRGWGELMRVRRSIEAGAVAPSTILRKLAAAGPHNPLSRALRGLARIERTLFTLQWLSDPALRQAVFFHRQGEFRTALSRTRASGRPGSAC